MQFRISVIPHTLHFNFNARTSRGAISEHKAYYLKLWSIYDPTINGVGECAPLKGLSIDYREDLPQKLEDICSMINSNQVNLKFDETLPEELELEEWPSVKFALETALLDLKCGGRRILYRNSFAKGESCISINGLVWMGDKQFMQEQIKCKLEEGFSCLKLKIGSLNFEQELEILQQIRDTASASDLTIRLDANGAFEVNEAIHKLEQLASYQIHSIEQPIKQGQVQQMAELCSHSPIPIALDEELIGIHKVADKEQLLRTIMPQYIILKPTLIGGFQACSEWIELAEKLQIGWWITSALESNIGLNAISQFTGNYKSDLPQGLGTGLLYQNNIDSPLTIDNGKLWFKKHLRWEEPEGLAIF